MTIGRNESTGKTVAEISLVIGRVECASRNPNEHLAPGIPRLRPSIDTDQQMRRGADPSEPAGSVGRRAAQSIARADGRGIGSDGRCRLRRGLSLLVRSSPCAVSAGRLLNLAVGVHPVALIPDAGTPLVLGDGVGTKATAVTRRGEIALSANRAITGGSVTRSVIPRSRVPGRDALLGGCGSDAEPDQAEGKSSTPDRSKATQSPCTHRNHSFRATFRMCRNRIPHDGFRHTGKPCKNTTKRKSATRRDSVSQNFHDGFASRENGANSPASNPLRASRTRDIPARICRESISNQRLSSAMERISFGVRAPRKIRRSPSLPRSAS